MSRVLITGGGFLGGYSAIIHLAALLMPACKTDPLRGENVNLIGTLNVFEAA